MKTRIGNQGWMFAEGKWDDGNHRCLSHTGVCLCFFPETYHPKSVWQSISGRILSWSHKFANWSMAADSFSSQEIFSALLFAKRVKQTGSKYQDRQQHVYEQKSLSSLGSWNFGLHMLLCMCDTWVSGYSRNINILVRSKKRGIKISWHSKVWGGET